VGIAPSAPADAPYSNNEIFFLRMEIVNKAAKQPRCIAPAMFSG
jgi:hypothetical protein